MAQSQAGQYRFALTERLAATRSSATIMRAPHVQRAILVLVDAIVIALSFLVAFEVVSSVRPLDVAATDYGATAAFTLLWLVVLWTFATYALRHTRAGSLEYKRAVNASVVAGGGIGIVCYLINYEYPRLLFAVWMLTGVTSLCVARLARRNVMKRLHTRELFVTPVLIVGSGHHVDEVAKVLDRERWLGYRVKGAVTDDGRKTTAAGVPILGTPSTLPAIIETTEVPVVVFAEGSFDSPGEFRRLAWQFEQSQVQMILAPTLADVSAERLEFRPLAGLPLVDVARPTALKSLRWFKRAMDVVGSAALLILAGPILLGAMLAVKLEDRGPVFFRQRRVGLNGREFDCLKLRSMCMDAEERLATLQAHNEGAGVLFKMKDDPRITRVGKFIRRYSLDELPQLWNTLIGDMSLVGPRPALPNEVERYDLDTRRRLHVRPGLTGLWQVSGRSSLSWEDTVRLDLYYVDNWSFIQDVMILLRTAKAVVGSAGAY